MPRITITDIARRAGVSTGAVSYALNDRPGVSKETRARILRLADEMGWQPSSAARTLSGARTETVGLVLAREAQTLGFESFYMQFIAGIESELATRSYALLLQVVPSIEHEVRTYRKWQAARRVDGVVMVDIRVDDPRIPVLTRPGALPAVVVGDPSLARGLTNVWTDDAAAMRESVRYLSTAGHRAIARVSGVAGFGHTHIRDVAFRAEIERWGLTGTVRHTDYTPQQGATATRHLLTAGERPTAIIFDNDVMAFAGLGVAAELGIRVPDELSIIAWDDSPLCQATFPQLSALSHDVTRFGAHVAARLFERLDGPAGGSHLDSTPTLRPRGTTAPVGTR
ncbi:LacI family DNA-binding transcriptional regulator [Cellulomonas sp. NPDC057328]|uniref:LacI family DNA-binding transcriptional regulator n=1 Tax=Cellulomonas sp. NPDC057328 TaxID=3346101 RepID=UPI00362DFDE3